MDAGPARRSIAFAALAVCLPAFGCAARRERFSTQTGSAPQMRMAPPRSSLAAPAGYASFGPNVRLRDDTPPLTPILEADHAAARRLAQEGTWVEASPYGAAGPSGAVGYIDTSPPPCFGPQGWSSQGWGAPGCGGPGWSNGSFPGPYAAPVGSIPSGIREAYDSPSPAFSGSTYSRTDTSDRPGISTGSGVYGRHGGR